MGYEDEVNILHIPKHFFPDLGILAEIILALQVLKLALNIWHYIVVHLAGIDGHAEVDGRGTSHVL